MNFQCLFTFLKKCISFNFGCVGSSLLRTGFLQQWRTGDTLRCRSHCGGFFCCGARARGVWASVVVAPGFSCSTRTRAQNSCPLALAGGFLTTAPPGKPLVTILKVLYILILLKNKYAADSFPLPTSLVSGLYFHFLNNYY